MNAVGVDLNTASVPLLTKVSGLNSTIAANIVAYREENGVYKSRAELKKVPRLGAKTFEQAAGFLKISNAKNPLDSSSVHPESYAVVKQICANASRDVKSIMGDGAFLKAVNASEFTSEEVGLLTVKDILKELEKPGRDPRPEFVTAEFKEGVDEIKDLRDDMVLQGVATNVTAFGAFVDIGVHQDGLVHISMMSDKFIDDPREVVKAGDVVTVKVMEVDVVRKRIALSMRMSDNAEDYQAEKATPRGERKSKGRAPQRTHSAPPASETSGGGMAALFAQAQKKKGKRL